VKIKIVAILVAFLLLGTSAIAADTNAKNVGEGADKVANVWKFPEYVTSCMKIDAIRNKALADLRLVRQFDTTLGWVGPALGLTEAAALAAQGRHLAALEKVGWEGLDLAVCTKNPVLCPAWAVGRTAGEIIDYLVSKARDDGKDAKSLFEDIYIKIGEGPATARELLKLQAAIKAAEARRETALRNTLSCEDPKQTRQGVDSLLNAAARLHQRPSTQTPTPPRSTPPVMSCNVLKDTAAQERLLASDPDAYDALVARCLK
jgi:hypothetical protein